jgi:hypothetical protein
MIGRLGIVAQMKQIIFIIFILQPGNITKLLLSRNQVIKIISFELHKIYFNMKTKD